MASGKKQTRPKTKGWMTTDAEEREIRSQRAEVEKMTVRALGDPSHGIFRDYEVISGTGEERGRYLVEMRSLVRDENTCTCPDFRKNGLGYCKHIARVQAGILRKCGKLRPPSPFTEVFMEQDPYLPRVRFGLRATPGEKRKLSAFLDPDGRVADPSPETLTRFLKVCDSLLCGGSQELRISVEVRRFAKVRVRQVQLAEAVANFQKAYADAAGKWPFLKHPLYPYQIEGAIHLAGKGRAMLADEMGLGKTVQAIAAALLLRASAGVRTALVIVPASLKAEWEDQIAFFSDAPLTLVTGNRAARLALYAKTDAFFVIANYEQVMRDWREINAILKPDLIILDEAQRIKNWQAKTARRLKRLESPYAFVLTGTPLENRIDELYSLAEFVDPRLFGSLFRFNRVYYRFDREGRTLGMQNLDDLHEKAATILLRRRKSAIEEALPARSDKNYFVPMTEEQLNRYQEEEAQVAKLCAIAKKRPLLPPEMKKLQRLLACMRMNCDSCYILDPEIRESPKVDEACRILTDIWEDDPGRKVILFSEWTRMLELMRERMDTLEIGYTTHTGEVLQDKRRENLRRFKTDPACKVLLTSESGGVGLNLQAASVVMNLDLPWNPARLEQRIARAWRKHQTHDVLVINLVAEGTIEHRMLATLKFKQGLADVVLDAVGESAEFEKNNARKAFMARVTELMQTDLNAGPAGASVNRPELEPAPEELLREAIQTGHPDIQLTTETAHLLAHLKRLGIIQFTDQSAERIFAREPATAPQESVRQRRLKAAREVFGDAERKVKMGIMLLGGGFEPEGAAALRDALRVAAGAAAFAETGDPETKPLPASEEDFVRIRETLALGDAEALTLQLALRDAPIPDCLGSVTRLMDRLRPFVDA